MTSTDDKTTSERLVAIIREHYLKPVMATIREIEENMSPEVRAFLTSLPNGGVWDELAKQRQKD